MQLQSIIGISRFKEEQKDNLKTNFETTTHSVNIKTFKKLQELGYIENLQEEFYKRASMPMESIAFGNIKGMFQKKDFYKLTFNKTDKIMDIEDPKLKKAFPLVFSKKKGIIATKGYKIENKNGELEVNYKLKTNTEETEYNSNEGVKNRQEFQDKIKRDVPTIEQQAKQVENFVKEENSNQNNNQQEKVVEENSR